MRKYQHITECPEAKRYHKKILDERPAYVRHKKCKCSPNCGERPDWEARMLGIERTIPICKKNGYLTQIAKVEGEGNFHKAMKILGNETRNNNWKEVFICSEIDGKQGCWTPSVKHGPPWVVVGFDTKYFKDTRLNGRKVINYE